MDSGVALTVAVCEKVSDGILGEIRSFDEALACSAPQVEVVSQSLGAGFEG
jgi:hypothetical protein